ncbi:MAG TPA: VCBS repeat-containing protein, partial [Polyangiales bacterium]
MRSLPFRSATRFLFRSNSDEEAVLQGEGICLMAKSSARMLPTLVELSCDIDEDGDLDLLVDNSGGVVRRGQYISQVNINDGKGYFTDQTAARSKGEPGGDAADFDGDGFIDVVTGQGEGEPRIDRVYYCYGMSKKDVTAPKFRAVEHPMTKAEAPIVLRLAVSDAYTSETGEHVASVSVDYEIEGEKKTVPAVFIGGDLFRAVIPGQADGTVVKVTPSAIDHGGLIGTSSSFELTVGMLPPPPPDAGKPATSMDAGVAPSVDASTPAEDAATPDDGKEEDDGCAIVGSKQHRTSSGVFFMLGLTFARAAS